MPDPELDPPIWNVARWGHFVWAGPSQPPPAPLFPTHKTHKHMSNIIIADFVPQSPENLDGWLELQLRGVIAPLATTIRATPDEHAAFLASVTALKAPAAHVVDLQHQLEEALAALRDAQAVQMPVIRGFIGRAKTSAGCTEAIKVAQKWIGEAHEIDYNTHRPVVRVKAQHGGVKVTGNKPGFAAMNVYCRIKGTLEWKLIALRLLKFPYFDERPLAVPGIPEVREYMGMGVVGNDEAGQPSEIREVAFAG